MKKEIALSIEQMKHLQDLGLDCSGASMVYRLLPESFRHFEDYYLGVRVESQENKEAIPAFCLQDILELLPEDICLSHCYKDFWQCTYNESGEDDKLEGCLLREGETALEVSYNMLLCCREKGYIKTNKTK